MKFKAWLLTLGSLGFTFITPLVAAYSILAVRETQEKYILGLFFWIVAGSVLVAFTVFVNKQFSSAKANLFKTTFKFVKNSVLISALWMFLSYVDSNITKLGYVVAITLAGMTIGKVLEFIAVAKYKDYMREVGIF